MRPSVLLGLALSSLAAAQKSIATDFTLVTDITLTTKPPITFNPTIITLTTKPTTFLTPICRTTTTVFQTQTTNTTQTQTQVVLSTRTATSLTTSTVTTTQTVKPTATGVHYDACPYPGWPLSVIDFEYMPNYPNISDYRGLKWANWAGFNYYPGYPDGWAPIPSNYTTGFTKTGGKQTELYIASGSRARLSGIHSFWFYYFESGVKSDAYNIIYIEGLSGGVVVQAIKIYTNTYQDGIWEHVCLDWQGIDTVRFVLPDCIVGNGCGGAWFEVDDIWVRGRGK